MKSRFSHPRNFYPWLTGFCLSVLTLSLRVQAATLVAEFNFETTNSATLAAGVDSSGNGNNATSAGSMSGPTDVYSTNAAVGSYARAFYGSTWLSFDNPSGAFSNLSNALSGSFSVTAWVNTTNSTGTDHSTANAGNPILYAFDTNLNSVMPLAITGSNAAITIADSGGTLTTLHSTSVVNDGNYHLLTATRNQTNGLMQMYVDGQFEASVTGPTNLLLQNFINGFSINLAGYRNGPGYSGLLDDVRVYSGVLSAADVATLAGTSANTFASAVNCSNVLWTTSGDTDWFIETTNTYDGTAAVQSGIVTNQQMSVISATVYGPGTVTFYWASQDQELGGAFGFDYVFAIDGEYRDDLYGNYDWFQDVPFSVPAGQHTLTWTVYSGVDNDPTEAGFLDQVSYVATPATPVTLTNAMDDGTNLSFSFLSQNGFPNTVQYKTNLLTGSWQDYTNILGDGTVKTVYVPLSVFGSANKGFVRIHP